MASLAMRQLLTIVCRIGREGMTSDSSAFKVTRVLRFFPRTHLPTTRRDRAYNGSTEGLIRYRQNCPYQLVLPIPCSVYSLRRSPSPMVCSTTLASAMENVGHILER